jgi:hypothetical protein
MKIFGISAKKISPKFSFKLSHSKNNPKNKSYEKLITQHKTSTNKQKTVEATNDAQPAAKSGKGKRQKAAKREKNY